jgi:hypothetical protein
MIFVGRRGIKLLALVGPLRLRDLHSGEAGTISLIDSCDRAASDDDCNGWRVVIKSSSWRRERGVHLRNCYKPSISIK